MTTFIEQYGYLDGLKVGEYEELDNSDEPHKKYYLRKFYSRVCSVVQVLNIRANSEQNQFCVRKASDSGDRIRVYRVSDGATSIEPPPIGDDPVRAQALAKAQVNRGIGHNTKKPAFKAERDVQRVLKQEEKRLALPENQVRALQSDTNDVYDVLGRSVAALVDKALRSHSVGREWFMVTVGGVPMGPPSETEANAKQSAKLFKNGKVVKLREV